MRCTHCGANIPDDQLICPVCGAEVQIVPDYNPLEDVLAREVKGSVDGATRQIRADDSPETECRGKTNRTRESGKITRIRIKLQRIASQSAGGRLDESREKSEEETAYGARDTAQRQQIRKQIAKQFIRKCASESSQMKSAHRTVKSRAGARRRSKTRRSSRKNAAKNYLRFFSCSFFLVGVGIYIGYQNSYTGMIKKGNAALQNSNYTSAENYFNRAIIKDKSKAEAYTGLANIYVAQDDLDSAESVYLNALETQPSNVNLYKAAVKFYEKTEQPNKISDLLQDCEDKNVLSAMNDYVSSAPEFSLKEGTYDEVQQVTLTSATGGTIYYTTDGSDPTESSTEYKEAVLLQSEGDTEIRAIAVNKKGIPSAVSSAKYSIEFPLVDAPAVSPSTGQYSTATQITITVPDGYTAYYTMDGSTPTASSEKYTDPIDMPEEFTNNFFSNSCER